MCSLFQLIVLALQLTTVPFILTALILSLIDAEGKVILDLKIYYTLPAQHHTVKVSN